ncbi:MAG: hypothetical protein LBC62_00605 [Treponema sp.]|jgi:hypothetical protein|nr:hypothetical protein [Treponema sp.]
MKGTVLQSLPDLFLMESGKKAASHEDWKARREELKRLAIGTGYGGMPPKPDSTEGELLSTGPGLQIYRVIARSGGRELSFELKLFIPFRFHGNEGKQFPVILEGDGCWRCLTEQVIEDLNRRDIIAAQFNRTAIVKDVDDTGEVLKSPLYRLFPGIEAGSLAGWAWGFSRSIDVLETLPFVDPRCIAITGHSRGGKAVLVAGAADERPLVVNPNCSGAGGAGCWRYHLGDESNRNSRSEFLSDLLANFPNWMGKGMAEFRDHEERIPFDQHYLKALVAPRYFLQTDGLLDFWANPPGSHATLMAAREAYRFLGVGDRILANYRNGGHDHSAGDFGILADLIGWIRSGIAPDKRLREDPFPDLDGLFVNKASNIC